MIGRDCAGWQGLLAMREIGRASDDELRLLDEHLGHCEACRRDEEALGGVAAALQSVDASQVDRLDRAVDPIPVRPAVEPSSLRGAGPREGEGSRRGSRRGVVGLAVAAGAVAAAAVALAVVGLHGPSGPHGRTVALTGPGGGQASVVLVNQSWGTRATLDERGQAPGEVLTVSMQTSSGHWWVAGSYRTTARHGHLKVELACAVHADQITDVWVRDQGGHTVLRGYVR